MTNFLSLPPELREQVYLELLVDPSQDMNRIMLTLNNDGHSVWDRVTEIDPDDEFDTDDIQPTLTQSSIKHLDYNNLWSLARANSLLYREITPLIYANACLEYTFGDACSATQSPGLLQTFIENLPAASCAFYRQLTIVNGKGLSAKAMKAIVDIINTNLPNLVSLEVRAIDPRFEAAINGEAPQFVREAMEMMAAARPLTLLNSSPAISLKPRVSFYLECDWPTNDPDVSLIMAVMQALMQGEVVPTLLGIRSWRRQAQRTHAMNCQEGDYLQLTSVLRSETVEDMDLQDMEKIGDMEGRLDDHQAVLEQIDRREHWRKILESCMRHKSF